MDDEQVTRQSRELALGWRVEVVVVLVVPASIVPRDPRIT
jgi:hypothetical protein